VRSTSVDRIKIESPWPGNLHFVKRPALVLLALMLVAIVGSACSTTKVAAPARTTSTQAGCPADETGDTCSTAHQIHVTATTTTTATSGVSQVGNGPLVAPCDQGGTAKFEPTIIYLACADGNTSVTDIVWSDWNETVGGGPVEADGTGVFNWNNCDPSCAQGQTFSVQVAIALTNPVIFQGTKVWGTFDINTNAGDLPGSFSTPPENGTVSQLTYALPDFGAP
jgi:hypothetical protein